MIQSVNVTRRMPQSVISGASAASVRDSVHLRLRLLERHARFESTDGRDDVIQPARIGWALSGTHRSPGASSVIGVGAIRRSRRRAR
jgi:hypothetical protein